MVSRWLQKGATAICDLSNIVMFWIFSKSSRIERFKISPLRFILYPAIALSVFINATLDLFMFINTSNKNLLKVSSGIASLINAFCSVVVNGGGFIAAFFHKIGFFLGTYFVLTGISAAFFLHFSQLLLKLTRFCLSPSYAKDLSDQKQTLVLHAFYSAMILSIYSGLLFTPLTPISFFITPLTIFFFATECVWFSILSDQQKDAIKNFFGFNDQAIKPMNEKESISWQKQRAINPALLTFFQPTYHYDTVNAHLTNQNDQAAKFHLASTVKLKRQYIQTVVKNHPYDKKHQHKLNILNEIDAHLNCQNLLNHDKLQQLCETNYLARQSFFSMAEGDLGDIIEATKLHLHTMESPTCSHQSVQLN